MTVSRRSSCFRTPSLMRGIADAILDELKMQCARAEFLVGTGGAFPERVLNTFGSDQRTADAFDEWDSIITWEAWHQSWVLVPGWEHDDVTEIVSRWPAQVKACEPINRRSPVAGHRCPPDRSFQGRPSRTWIVTASRSTGGGGCSIVSTPRHVWRRCWLGASARSMPR